MIKHTQQLLYRVLQLELICRILSTPEYQKVTNVVSSHCGLIASWQKTLLNSEECGSDYNRWEQKGAARTPSETTNTSCNEKQVWVEKCQKWERYNSQCDSR